jgi:hypothetical protein
MVFSMASKCDGQPATQSNEQSIQQQNYDSMTKSEPAVKMPYSPTLRTINFFAETWGHDPDKLSYVYLSDQNGQTMGYYVLKGLPVSYCAQRFSPVRQDWSGNGGALNIPMPALDGAYYTTGPCSTLYGRDANTNGYVEWTLASGIMSVSDRPRGRPETDSASKALGPTVIGTEHH